MLDLNVDIEDVIDITLDDLNVKPKPFKVAVYAISKNEEAFAKRCIDSALKCENPADYFILADTGSTDGTVQAARAAGATVSSITVSPWRFDTARNAALSLVPSDVDICVSLDLDEILQSGWRTEVERLFRLNSLCTRAKYKYDWGSGVVFYSEKIHSRKGYRWKHPCHERVVPDCRTREVIEITDMLLIKHFADQTKDRSSYLPLLEVGIKEDPNDKRNIMYHARELSFAGRYKEAIERYKLYLDNKEYDWPEERGYTYELIADAHGQLGDHVNAKRGYLQAVVEAPHVRKFWLALAAHARLREDWDWCLFAAEQAIKLNKRDFLYFDDETSWKEKPYFLASLGAYYSGNYEKAHTYGSMALEIAPGEEYLKNNLKFFKEKING